jgi:N-acetylglucosaminyldiphosphoundecaprenol N-acetyl-beta-D-mannosaminyltransferase
VRATPGQAVGKQAPQADEPFPARRDRDAVGRTILGVRVDATNYGDATERICSWAEASESRYVCVAAVNNVVQALDDGDFRAIMNRADLVTPDGMPLVWGLRMLGVRDPSRVYGPVLTDVLCARAAEQAIGVGFYGGTPEVLDALIANLLRLHPRLNVGYRYSPPFGPLDSLEDDAVVREIDRSGVRILFVGLGAPKQEQWMARQRPNIHAVMVGVGAAFDFLANNKKQAPRWIQHLGLEWLFRLVHEPRRLWRRYLFGNPRFAVLFTAQIVRERWRRRTPSNYSRRRRRGV